MTKITEHGAAAGPPKVLELLERALVQTEAIVAAMEPDQASWPTPCRGWNVATLYGHLAAVSLPNFILAAQGGAPDWSAGPEPVQPDGGELFHQGAQELRRAWAHAEPDADVAGPGGRPVKLITRADVMVAELAMHGWDLARATGQRPALDTEVAEYALNWSKGKLRPEYRGPDKGFGAEVPVAADAPVYERLMAWTGRDPQWIPA